MTAHLPPASSAVDRSQGCAVGTDAKSARKKPTSRRWQPGKPISDEERPYLRALGVALRDLRAHTGLTVLQFCYRALITEGHFWHLVAGVRRTRRSTIARLVAAAVEANPELGPADPIVDRLCEVAGPALASESIYADRVERKLQRRARRRERGTWTP